MFGMPLRRVVFGILYLAIAATFAARMVLTLYALDAGLGEFRTGLLAAMIQLPSLFLSVPVGMLCDRYGARWLMAGAALTGAAGLALPYALPGVASLFVGAALLGVFSVVIMVLSQVVVGQLSHPDELTRTYGNLALVLSATAMTGPLVGGYAIQLLGHERACLALAGVAVFVAASVLAIGSRLPPGQGARASKTRLSDTLRDPGFWRIMWMNAMVQMAVDFYPFCMPLYGHALGLEPAVIGWIMASGSATSFAMRFTLPHTVPRFGEERLLAFSMGMTGLAFMVMPFMDAPLLLVGAAMLYGIGVSSGAPVTTLIMYKRSGKGAAGQSMGLRMTGNAIVRIAGPSGYGALSVAAGLFTVFLTCGALLWISALAVLKDAPAPAPGPDSGGAGGAPGA